MLLAGGLRALLAPDLRAPQHIATGAILGLLLALPIGLVGGTILGLLMLAVSCIALVAGGWHQLGQQPAFEDIPAPDPTPLYCARVALDDTVLNLFSLMAPLPKQDDLKEAVRESETAHALFTDRGWIGNPASFHVAPPEIQSVEWKPIRVGGFDCEQLSFDSEFEPHPGMPGRDRWLSYRENRTCHAWVLCNKQPGPWLICVHGAAMGNPRQDFRAFRARELHERTGLNVAMYVLPVHGPRTPGGFSGAKFFGHSPLDFLHAESQAIWDLRRLIDWLYQQEASQIGVFGISLGGYTSALLAGLEDRLDCVIASVPPSDMIHTTREYLAGSVERRLSAAAGVDNKRDRELYRVVSPLAMSPRVEHKGRFIFAATGDQFVPIEQVRALWLHWQKPRISWCTGGHLSSQMQREFHLLVDEAIANSFGPSSVGAKSRA
ncbi:MAG: prolyl oligopeptidase family serine peptidase [Halioglobus sp.]|nr:prolyl oligopeptidase family serine peptidase [Halioglobus sp.]